MNNFLTVHMQMCTDDGLVPQTTENLDIQQVKSLTTKATQRFAILLNLKKCNGKIWVQIGDYA